MITSSGPIRIGLVQPNFWIAVAISAAQSEEAGSFCAYVDGPGCFSLSDDDLLLLAFFLFAILPRVQPPLTTPAALRASPLKGELAFKHPQHSVL
jgi:hypothetical protein